MKRQRGRGRKSGNPNNRTFESNGPDVKIRGNAAHIYDKYLQLARDATSSGDRVMAENYYQHAEHYLRIVQANQPKKEETESDAEQPAGEAEQSRAQGGEPQAAQARNGQGEAQPENPGAQDESDGAANRPRRGRRRRKELTDADDPLQVVDLDAGASDGAPAEADAASEPAGDGDAPAEEAPRKRSRTRRSKADKAAEDALKAAESKANGSEEAGEADGQAA